ncbi:NAD(+) synthase [Ketobacter alkanivorans]|uniref:NH(3)-dependent NAD(+) synthetase n=1 Tax=Ketobacter alkanivorans TaxID=1917421 RepID=A0A2K9LMU6_9GAMM|nr:NAD(+) synthase [Ketobacter alkanivorans]AUM13612.1 NAD(+) synthase [Ketobacter alkanivorans]MCP5018263.1 NAD(+) synthase [Ketobacter sp.]
MSLKSEIAQEILSFDMDAEIDKICSGIREILSKKVHRRGLVIAMSGGIDSSVSSALCVRAVGPKKVFGLLLPEQDSSSESEDKGRILAEHHGIEYLVHNIAPTLEAIGCYKWRDEAIVATFPEYGEGWKNKIVISGGAEGKINHFQLVVQSPTGEISEKRLGLKEYLQIVAATNYKQRIRKTVEFFHADRLNYAVVGTPNRVEYDQGFFVKNGDGSADLKPIAHLYKTQVYALARHMGLPEVICNAIPTTDTYSMPQGQDEFYYALPYQEMDIALWCYNKGESAAQLAKVLEITEEQAQFIYTDIESKRKTTAPFHWPAILIEKVEL